MKIFISWSGPVSKKVAMAFNDWIPSVIQSAKTFFSPDDLGKGTRWSTTLAKELGTTNFGILCVTKDNINSPWLNFEAGALSKMMESSYVCPFLFDLKSTDIVTDSPILQFNYTKNNKDEIYKLIKTINKSAGEEALKDATFDRTFELWWNKLEEELIKIEQEKPIITMENQITNPSETNNKILEEILEIERSQQRIFGNPELLLPSDYIKSIFHDVSKMKVNQRALNDLYYSYNQLNDSTDALVNSIHDVGIVTADNEEIMELADKVKKDCRRLSRPVRHILKSYSDYFRNNKFENNEEPGEVDPQNN